jgi:hypothetical protein
MTKIQQVKTFARLNGLTVKACHASQTVSIHGKITWNGERHVGWADIFDNYEQVYDFLLECTKNGRYPWREA